MNEKRFTVMKKFDGSYVICDNGKMLVADDCCDLLNELNKDFEDCEKLLDSKDDFIHKFKKDIEELGISIKLFEDDIATKDKKIDEQQATIKVYEEGVTMKIKKINEQKALITNLQGEVNRLQYIIDELRKDNYKRFEKINELKAKLKEKEEDEQLYANEIVKLNKEAKEVLDFKSLGGDY